MSVPAWSREHGRLVHQKALELAKARRSAATLKLEREDVFQTWERRATELSRLTAARYLESGMTEEDWTRELAERLVYEVLQEAQK
jgi:hypothetical protein